VKEQGGNMLLDKVKIGSRWRALDGKVFTVLHTVSVDGIAWIHYRQLNCPECREHSCYLESFLERFRVEENYYGS
jgi:hypothetical protein